MRPENGQPASPPTDSGEALQNVAGVALLQPADAAALSALELTDEEKELYRSGRWV